MTLQCFFGLSSGWIINLRSCISPTTPSACCKHDCSLLELAWDRPCTRSASLDPLIHVGYVAKRLVCGHNLPCEWFLVWLMCNAWAWWQWQLFTVIGKHLKNTTTMLRFCRVVGFVPVPRSGGSDEACWINFWLWKVYLGAGDIPCGYFREWVSTNGLVKLGVKQGFLI